MGVKKVFNHQEFNQYWEFWNKIRKGNSIPLRKDFKPEQIFGLLSEICIYDWKEPDFLNIRLIGSEAVDRVGVNPTGQNYLDWAAPAVGDFMKNFWRSIFNYPAGMQGTYQDRSKTGRIIENGFLALPLKVAGQEDAQMMLLEKDLQIEELAYDKSSPEIVTLGIKDMKLIDLGFGLPDLNMDEIASQVIYTG